MVYNHTFDIANSNFQKTYPDYCIMLLAVFAAQMIAMSGTQKVNITRVDPTDWYAGMKNQTLQLMVYMAMLPPTTIA